MRAKNLLITGLLAFIVCITHAQTRQTGNIEYIKQLIKNDTGIKQMMQSSEKIMQEWIQSHPGFRTQSIVTIPVVVHVLWHDTVQNISDAQIQSQIDVLNRDFRKLNSDTLAPSHPFAPLAGDAQIEFCLAQRDPSGNPSNGITRTNTPFSSFNNIDSVPYTVKGGEDNWDARHYLNIWTCNLVNWIGVASFPSLLATKPKADGVYVRYTALGTTGTATPPFDKGRTTTQLVSNWLNLRHIWGDATCGNDSVADTPPATGPNYGCPSFPHNANNACGSDINGEMFMNFQDYVDDNCMVMFTQGQILRMDATLNTLRSALWSSNGCLSVGIDESSPNENRLIFFSNPATTSLNVHLSENIKRPISFQIYDLVGRELFSQSSISIQKFEINVSGFMPGIYFLRMKSGNEIFLKQFIKE